MWLNIFQKFFLKSLNLAIYMIDIFFVLLSYNLDFLNIFKRQIFNIQFVLEILNCSHLVYFLVNLQNHLFLINLIRGTHNFRRPQIGITSTWLSNLHTHLLESWQVLTVDVMGFWNVVYLHLKVFYYVLETFCRFWLIKPQSRLLLRIKFLQNIELLIKITLLLFKL